LFLNSHYIIFSHADFAIELHHKVQFPICHRLVTVSCHYELTEQF